MRNAVLILLLPVVITACAEFQNSPFTDHLSSNGSNFNLNQKECLLSGAVGVVPSEETGIKIALMSDNHVNYNDVDTVVDLLNQRHDINFVVHTGDITNSAYNFEYDAFIQKFTRLMAPSFVVIGNHDAIGKGRKIYQNYFGDYNYSFVYHGFHFIFFNNNRMEFLEEGWSLNWLETELAKNPGLPKVVFQHINYDNADAFTPEISEQMKSLYENNNVQWVVNGHRHTFSYGVINNVHYVQVPRTEDARYLILSLKEGEFQLESYKGGQSENTYQGTLAY